MVSAVGAYSSTIDNVKGVPGIGEKGARDLICHLRHARRAARACRGGPAEEVSRGALTAHAAEARQQPRAAPDSHGRAGRLRAGAFRYRGAVARRLLRPVFRARLSLLRDGVRANRGDDHQGLPPARTRPEELDALRANCARRAALAAGVVRRSDSGSGRHCRTVIFDGPPMARYVPIGHRPPGVEHGLLNPSPPAPAAATLGAPRGCARGAQTVLEDPAIRKVGHDLKFDADRARAAWRHAARARPRHDAGELPARRDPVRSPARGPRARAPRLQGAHRGRRLRPGRQGHVVRGRRRPTPPSTTPASARTSRCSSPTELRDCSRRTSSTGVRRLWSVRSSRCSRRSSGPACASTGRRSRRSRSTSTGADAAGRADLTSSPASEFNINSPKQLVEDPVRQAAAAGAQAERQDQGTVDGRRRARGARARARPAAAHPRVARRCRS